MYSYCLALTGEMISYGQNSSQVVLGVAPLSGEEAVIEIEPADLRPDIECTPDRVKLVVGSRDASSYNNRAFNGMTCK